MKRTVEDRTVIGLIIFFTLVGFILGIKLCNLKIDNLCQSLNPNSTQAYLDCKYKPTK